MTKITLEAAIMLALITIATSKPKEQFVCEKVQIDHNDTVEMGLSEPGEQFACKKVQNVHNVTVDVGTSELAEQFTCKKVQNVHQNHTAFVQEIPDERVAPIIQGGQGQGSPGNPRLLDYKTISHIIDKKIRQRMKKMRSEYVQLQRNFAEFLSWNETKALQQSIRKEIVPLNDVKSQRCKKDQGLLYDGTCYFVGDVASSLSMNYNKAVQVCNNRNSLLAELHSLAHQTAIQEFFQKTIIVYLSNRRWMWTGMTYQNSTRSVRFRSGKEVSIDQYHWSGFNHSGTNDKILITITLKGYKYEGLYNEPATNLNNGAICERSH